MCGDPLPSDLETDLCGPCAVAVAGYEEEAAAARWEAEQRRIAAAIACPWSLEPIPGVIRWAARPFRRWHAR